MIVWLAQNFVDETWFADRDKFEKLWRTMKYPKEMLLGLQSQPGGREVKLLIRGPASITSEFPGFRKISVKDLPKKAMCLVESAGEFWKVFERP